MKTYFGGLRTVAALCVGALVAVASAQNPGDPGFFVRAIDSGGTVDRLEAHDNVLGGISPVNGITESTADLIDYNGGNNFPVNSEWFHPYTEDFVVVAIADVTIPAGHWGIGWTSDDGGQITIPGVEFVTSYEQNGGDDFYDPNGDIIGGDRIYFDGNRGNRASFGSFVLEQPLTTQINASMWERGGGDNWELAYIDLNFVYGIDADELTNFPLDQPSQENLWNLLNDSDSLSFSWDVRIPEEIPEIAIPVSQGDVCNPDTGADINGDGEVGFTDFIVLSANFDRTGLTGASHELGDLDCNGDVAFPDFLALSNVFGTSVGAEASSVPEPSTVTLLGLGALLLGLVRRPFK